MLLKSLKLKNMKIAMTEGVSLDVDASGIVNAEREEDIEALRTVGFVEVKRSVVVEKPVEHEMIRQDMRLPEMPAVKTFKRRKKQ